MTQYLHYFMTAALVLNFAAIVFHFIFVMNKKEIFRKASWYTSLLGFVSMLIYLVARGIIAQRFPISNQFEFAATFAFGIHLFYIGLHFKYKESWLSSFILPGIFLVMSYAYLLPSEINELMPALKSQWFVSHILSAALAYSSFAISAFISIKYLIDEKKANNKNVEIDYLSYKLIGFGFLMLSVTILTGCIWAEQAWSRFWSWDPKETWALITWIIYSIYLHQRLRMQWQGRKMAILSIFAFVFVIFTFVGVNTLLTSLHSYAFHFILP